jgi:hypothetical protein
MPARHDAPLSARASPRTSPASIERRAIAAIDGMT